MANKGMEFVEAATAIGASNSRLIFRHLLPNSLAPIIVQGTVGIASGILCACGLSFLGLGIQPPTAEWGHGSLQLRPVRFSPVFFSELSAIF